MRTLATGFLIMVATAVATPAAATVMIAEPARQPAACFDSASPCDPQSTPAVVAAAPARKNLPSPLIPAVVGVLALGLAFARRQGGTQQVVC
jgi:hypothetical protein